VDDAHQGHRPQFLSVEKFIHPRELFVTPAGPFLMPPFKFNSAVTCYEIVEPLFAQKRANGARACRLHQ
jgi:hypothetical protein